MFSRVVIMMSAILYIYRSCSNNLEWIWSPGVSDLVIKPYCNLLLFRGYSSNKSNILSIDVFVVIVGHLHGFIINAVGLSKALIKWGKANF